MAAAKKPAKRAQGGLSSEEKDAARERVKELKAQAAGADGEKAILAKIASMAEPSRTMAKKVHAIIRAAGPSLVPRTWYGMPAYSSGDSVVVFFRNAEKFKERYATIGFNPEAKLDEGKMWPIAFAIIELGPAEEARIAALVKKAVG